MNLQAHKLVQESLRMLEDLSEPYPQNDLSPQQMQEESCLVLEVARAGRLQFTAFMLVNSQLVDLPLRKSLHQLKGHQLLISSRRYYGCTPMIECRLITVFVAVVNGS